MKKSIETVPRYSQATIDIAQRGGCTPRQLAAMRRKRIAKYGTSPDGYLGVWDVKSGHYVTVRCGKGCDALDVIQSRPPSVNWRWPCTKPAGHPGSEKSPSCIAQSTQMF